MVLGIAADHTQHLLWRLSNGELSAPMAADPNLIAVLLIGTNNLGNVGRLHDVDTMPSPRRWNRTTVCLHTPGTEVQSKHQPDSPRPA